MRVILSFHYRSFQHENAKIPNQSGFERSPNSWTTWSKSLTCEAVLVRCSLDDLSMLRVYFMRCGTWEGFVYCTLGKG